MFTGFLKTFAVGTRSHKSESWYTVYTAMVVGSSPDGLNHVGRNHKGVTTRRKYSQRKSQHVGYG